MEQFTEQEQAVLRRHFSNLDLPVFALHDLPEVVKGALFARYSRSPKSLRRLFLDEFAGALGEDDDATPAEGDLSARDKAEVLYDRIFSEYGDDSVAQLGGAHVATEHISNLMTKQIEWGRLAAYLEQSSRYIPYTDQITRPDGSVGWRYHRDADIMAGPHAEAYVRELDAIFEVYTELVPIMMTWVRERFPQDEFTSSFVWKNATKAKALDLLRGLLPAATTSHVGIFASGQSYEQLLLRLRSSELAEARTVADQMLGELRTVIPSFLVRVDRPDRGGVWSQYLADTRSATRELAAKYLTADVEPAELVTLVDWWPKDPRDAEIELATAILHSATNRSEEQVRREVAELTADDRAAIVRAYVGDRTNRRHKPGRAFERIFYRFDVLGDYGGFRDLQRHRMLTIEWQDLSPEHGYETPPELVEAGVADRWHEALQRSADLHALLHADHPAQSQYAVCFAYRVRYTMQLNARAAMQMLELRSTPQGHPAYREIAQQMHRKIRDVAGHELVHDAMQFVDHGSNELERLESERAAEARRGARGAAPS